jgi:hypothetical protein
MPNARDAREVVVASSGDIYVAPVDTPEPTTEVDELDPDWYKLGFTTEAGVNFSLARTITDLPAWQTRLPLRRLVDAIVETATFVLRQFNGPNLQFAFGGGTLDEPTTGHYTYDAPDADDIDERAMVIAFQDGDKFYRLWTPKGNVTGQASIPLTRSDAANLPIEYSPLQLDEDTPTFRLFTNDPAFAPIGS